MNEQKLKIFKNEIKLPTGKTILKVRGIEIKEPTGKTILKVRGKEIKQPTGKTILMVRGKEIKQPTGKTILKISGDQIKLPTGKTVLKFSNKLITRKGDVPIGTSEVIAVLVAAGKIKSGGSGKGGCFIATATMGDYDHPVVLQLREFRDQYLLKRNWGKTFTKYYYKFGPYPAKVISRSNFLKKISYVFIVKPLSFIARRVMDKKQ